MEPAEFLAGLGIHCGLAGLRRRKCGAAGQGVGLYLHFASTSEIKNYISDAYYNWEIPPEIVGLIGDTGGNFSLPNYSHSWGGYGGATDFDYTQLDGGDLIPEIFIGRISGSSSSLSRVRLKVTFIHSLDIRNKQYSLRYHCELSRGHGGVSQHALIGGNVLVTIRVLKAVTT